MKFLLLVSLAAVAVVIASRNKKMRESNEESDYDDEIITDNYEADYHDSEKPAFAGANLYAEPSSLTIPEKHEGDVDNFNRPEYAADNVPQLNVSNEEMMKKV